MGADFECVFWCARRMSVEPRTCTSLRKQMRAYTHTIEAWHSRAFDSADVGRVRTERTEAVQPKLRLQPTTKCLRRQKLRLEARVKNPGSELALAFRNASHTRALRGAWAPSMAVFMFWWNAVSASIICFVAIWSLRSGFGRGVWCEEAADDRARNAESSTHHEPRAGVARHWVIRPRTTVASYHSLSARQSRGPMAWFAIRGVHEAPLPWFVEWVYNSCTNTIILLPLRIFITLPHQLSSKIVLTFQLYRTEWQHTTFQ